MSTLPIAFKTRRANRWFVGLSAFILVAGIVAVLVVLLTRSGSEGLSNAPVHVTKNAPEKNVPIAKEAQAAVKTFLQTAVPRKNLAAAWPVAGPQIREGMTRAQFLSGNIAVVPLFQPILKATFKTVYSHPKDALIQVGLIVGSNKNIHVKLYDVTLAKIGSKASAHWVVNGWVLHQVYGVQSTQ